MTRARRWLVGIAVVAVVGAGLLVALGPMLMSELARRQVAGMLADAGIEDAAFKVERAGLSGAVFTGIALDDAGGFTIARLVVRYHPLEIVAGRLREVEIVDLTWRLGAGSDGIDWGSAAPLIETALAPSEADAADTSTGFPLDVLSIEDATLQLELGEETWTVPVSGRAVRSGEGGSFEFDVQLPMLPISAHGSWIDRAEAVVLSGAITGPGIAITLGSPQAGPVDPALAPLELTSDMPLVEVLAAYTGMTVTGPLALTGSMDVASSPLRVQLTLATQGVDVDHATFEAREVAGRVTVDRFAPLHTWSGQSLTFGALDIGRLHLRDGRIVFGVESPRAILLEQATARIDGGGQLWLTACRLDPQNPAIDVQVFVERLTVTQWVQWLSGENVSATGRLDGRIPVHYTPGSNQPISLGEGYLLSRPEGGAVSITEPEIKAMLARLLDQSDPRFRQDDRFAQVKERLLEAVTAMRYELLRFEFHRQGGELVCTVQVRGRGQLQGQEVNLTINLRGVEAYLNSALMIGQALQP